MPIYYLLKDFSHVASLFLMHQPIIQKELYQTKSLEQLDEKKVFWNQWY